MRATTRAFRATSRTRMRARKAIVWTVPGLAAAMVSGWAQQQITYDHSFLMRTEPMPYYRDTPDTRDYNLKWGPLLGRLYGSMQVEFSDNINLDELHPQSDVYFYPNFGIGFEWPISPQNQINFNIGAGYRIYVKHPGLDTFQITPDSQLLYRMRAGKVDLIFHDSLMLQVDPLTRPDISGTTNGTLIDFRRLNNDSGVQAVWRARSDVSVVTSYDFLIDRTLNSQFRSLDRNDHNFGAGVFADVGSSWNVGVNGGLTISEYLLPIQNDGISYSIGPQASVKLSKFVSAEASLTYTRAIFEHTGTIADRSNFSGLSYSLGIKHNMNSRATQSLRVAHSITPGFGSNYDELTTAQYSLNWRMNSYLSLTSTFSYENIEASGLGGESANRYIWYAGTGWQVARRWNLGVAYSFAWKDSDIRLRDYTQNRVTLDLTHDF